jgi:hypothetical protein
MKIRICVLILILFCVALAGCRSENPGLRPGSTRPYTVWFSDPKDYYTNILTVAQAETPFTLVLPTYLPEGISPIPHLSGRARDEFDNEIPVRIEYKKVKDDNVMVDITEFNLEITTLPYDEDIYLEYSNNQVLEHQSKTVSMNGNGKITGDVVLYTYSWNNSGLCFNVSIREMEREEARKIVQSMIE